MALMPRQAVFSCAARPMRPAVAAVPGPRRGARRAATVSRATATEAPAKFIPRWDQCYDFLKSKGLRTVAPQDAAKMVESGEWVLIDVRRADQHEKSAPKSAANVPLYKKLDMGSGFDLTKLLRTAMYAFNGVDPIEPNTQFAAQVAELAGGRGVIFACEAGGTLRPSVNFPAGKASRSLQACYKTLTEAGIERVQHLDRGIYGWYQADLPFAGEYKPEIGRFPSAASEPTLQNINQGRGYDVRPGDKKE